MKQGTRRLSKHMNEKCKKLLKWNELDMYFLSLSKLSKTGLKDNLLTFEQLFNDKNSVFNYI